MNRIIFLGTGGARVLVFKQLLASGGLWIEQAGTRLHLDPGPGALVQAAKRDLDPTKLDAILLSHRHLDHSADVNVMIELMTDGGFIKRGILFAPEQALSGDDPVVLNYVRQFPERIEVLKPDTDYTLGELRFRTHGKHHHSTETYGFTFSSTEGPVSFVVDTLFFPELCEWYAGSAVLVINLVRLIPHESEKVMHLTYDDAKTLIGTIRPRLAIITHFGMTMIKAKPWEVAKKLSGETGVEVIAAGDGKTVELAKREKENQQTDMFG
jgi:phosphoribosyl 1,2-cyclic phosphodiesterase